MKWAGHVARMEERRGEYMVLVGKSGERDHLEDPSINGRIRLQWNFKKWGGESRIGLI